MITRTGDIFSVLMDQTVPPALRHDQRIVALARAVAEQLQNNAALIRQHAGLFYQIDELCETVLDMLAGDLHVDWYDYTDDLETKRNVIKNSVYVHRHLGTPAAIKRVLEDCFGDGMVEEWFDYGGEPYHFRVRSDSVEAVYANLDRFLELVDKVKRLGATLESVQVEQNRSMTAAVGMANKVKSVQTSMMREGVPEEIDGGSYDYAEAEELDGGTYEYGETEQIDGGRYVAWDISKDLNM